MFPQEWEGEQSKATDELNVKELIQMIDYDNKRNASTLCSKSDDPYIPIPSDKVTLRNSCSLYLFTIYPLPLLPHINFFFPSRIKN